MTDTVPVTSNALSDGQIPRDGRRHEGSRPQFSNAYQRGRGMRSNRGEYRGQRGAKGHWNRSSITANANLGTLDARPLDQSANNGAGSDIHADAEKSSQGQDGQEPVGDQNQPAEESECIICASTIKHLSITPCNHRPCHICALRWRALYKKRNCAYCNTEAAYVIITDDAVKRYEDFAETDFVRSDENLGIRYVDDVVLEDTVLLLRYNCPDQGCDVACTGWPHLHRHVKEKHRKLMCDLCIRNKKYFPHEHELFTYVELQRHMKDGDDNPGAIDQSGFKGHPECGFCHERFYGDDELYNHCVTKHERCHICDRRNPGSQVQYYLNYQTLEKHFEQAHFVCLDAECQANKTNVFESEMDLKAHQLSSHPNGLSKDARRDARLVSLSSFDYRTPYQPQRRGEREHRGNGRGRDPNVEAPSVSSAHPLPRAELAFQRQMAILNEQPQVISRNHAVSPMPTSNPRPAPSSTQLAGVDASSIEPFSTASGCDQEQSPQEQARRLRHASVIQRASTLLKEDSGKLSTFRTHLSSYRRSIIDAAELINSFFSLFDVPSAELGKLVRELAELYEDDTKRQELLKAWNDWLSINADYPSLPKPSGSLQDQDNLGIGGAWAGRHKVLRLKSSTAQSSRSIGNNGSSSKPNPFPALGGAASSLSSGLKRPGWAPLSAAASALPPAPPPSSSVPASPADRRPLSRGAANPAASEEMFPALPGGKKPDTLMAGLTRGSVRWDDGRNGRSSAANPWGGASAAAGGETAHQPPQLAAADGIPEAVASGKKAKKGKQVLYKFG